MMTDCLPVARASDPSRADGVHPYHQLIRRLECTGGEVSVEMQFSPRFDFGLTTPRLELLGEGRAICYGGADALVLQTDFSLTQKDLSECRGELHLGAGQQSCTLLTYALPHRIDTTFVAHEEIVNRLRHTETFWTEWSDRCPYDGPFKDAVIRSALVLKALSNAPTGAILAAPTTSLPERIGGSRNWDYRYSWLRDAALNLYALFGLGYTSEAHAFMEWVKRTTAGRAEDLQIMYGAGGERLIPEVELTSLEGYRGSAPVRIGNAAADQFQLDVFGELMDTAWLYHKHGGAIDGVFWEFLRGVVGVVCRRWTEPDEGIWEVRGGPRHFIFSKMMAWVALDRGIRLAVRLGLPAEIGSWKVVRKQIRAWIETNGVDPATGAFVQSSDSTALDSATLLMPLVGFVPHDHPSVKATRARILKELTTDGLVYRYLTPDGLEGGEGAFIICSFWMVDNLAIAGEMDKAGELFERLVGYSNDVGLLSEEVDPATGDLLGNFPQAFSHVGLIGAAMNLSGGLDRHARRAKAATGQSAQSAD